MTTPTPATAQRALDLLAIQAAVDSLTVFDCTGSAERQAQHIENMAWLHADKLAGRGIDPMEAAALSQHMLKAAHWCLAQGNGAADGIGGADALLADAVQRAMIILEITGGDDRAAVQLAEHGALTHAGAKLQGEALTAFTSRLQGMVRAAVERPQGAA